MKSAISFGNGKRKPTKKFVVIARAVNPTAGYEQNVTFDIDNGRWEARTGRDIVQMKDVRFYYELRTTYYFPDGHVDHHEYAPGRLATVEEIREYLELIEKKIKKNQTPKSLKEIWEEELFGE